MPKVFLEIGKKDIRFLIFNIYYFNTKNQEEKKSQIYPQQSLKVETFEMM